MATTTTTTDGGTSDQPPGPRPHSLVLAPGCSAVERTLIERFIASEHPDSELRYLDDERLAERLAAGDNPSLVPVRVVWLPRERKGGRRAGLGDLLALTNPR